MEGEVFIGATTTPPQLTRALSATNPYKIGVALERPGVRPLQMRPSEGPRPPPVFVIVSDPSLPTREGVRCARRRTFERGQRPLPGGAGGGGDDPLFHEFEGIQMLFVVYQMLFVVYSDASVKHR